MAINFPGPCQMRIFYTVDVVPGGALQHKLQLNFIPDNMPDVGDPFEDIDITRRTGGPIAADTVVNAITGLLQPLWNADDMTIDYAEIWAYEPLSFDAYWISSYTIGQAATGLGTTQPCGEQIHTFRTQEGGLMRVHLMETTCAFGPSLNYGDLSDDNKAWVNYFTSSDASHFVARDTSYPLAFLRMHPGQNEALFKARYR